MHVTFGAPWFLLLLPLAVCFWVCPSSAERFFLAQEDWLPKRAVRLTIATWLVPTIYVLLVVALAQPFTYERSIGDKRKGRDLVLVLDASGSMAQRGFGTGDRSKFGTLLSLIDRFINKRGGDNIGIVVFGTFAYTAVPLTYDREALRYLVRMLDVGVAGENTAVGDALMQALRTLHFGDAKRKAVVLFTDGRHNAGKRSPKEAVMQAVGDKVRIYTVGIGRKGDYDADLLRRIAKETHAQSFQAADESALHEVFAALDKLEPSPIRARRYLGRVDWSLLPSLAALLLLLVLLRHERRKERV